MAPGEAFDCIRKEFGDIVSVENDLDQSESPDLVNLGESCIQRSSRVNPTEQGLLISSHSPGEPLPIPMRDVVIGLIGAPNGPLNRVSIIVQQKNDRPEPLRQNRAKFLGGHQRGSVASENDQTPRRHCQTRAKRGWQGIAYGCP